MRGIALQQLLERAHGLPLLTGRQIETAECEVCRLEGRILFQQLLEERDR